MFLCIVIGFCSIPTTARKQNDRALVNRHERERTEATVRIGGSDVYGSGTIVRKLMNGHWLIVTTAHVLQGPRHEVCISFSDGATAPGVVVHAVHEDQLDLAVLVSQATSSMAARVAQLDQRPPRQGQAVIAVGFPAGSNYREHPGQLVQQPRHALKGGYQLAYTSDIQKGMSGGGVFTEDNRLIGLNALHAAPLWSAPLHYSNGSAVSAQETERLEGHALGLGAPSIAREIDRLPDRAIRQGMKRLATRAGRSCGQI